MLTCDEAVPLIVQLADGPLDASDCQRLDAHVESCAGCRIARAEQMEVAGLLRSLPPLEPPPRVAHAIVARLADPAAWLELIDWRKWSWRLAPVAATLLLVAFSLGQHVAATATLPTLQTLPTTTTSSVTFPGVVERLTVGRTQGSLPSTSLLWQPEVNRDSLLLVVLTHGADEQLEDGPGDPGNNDAR